jgi:hypothetical protein
MKFIDIFKTYFAYVLAGISNVQQAIGPGNGATKKALVLAGITAAASVGEQVPETHVAAISALIDSTVAILNKTNLLGFGGTAATQTTTVTSASVTKQ